MAISEMHSTQNALKMWSMRSLTAGANSLERNSNLRYAEYFLLLEIICQGKYSRRYKVNNKKIVQYRVLVNISNQEGIFKPD